LAKEPGRADALAESAALAALGQNLLKQEKWIDAEPHLRACVALREKSQPDDWRTFNAKSMLGEALVGQKRYADAKPLLVNGYAGMKEREGKIVPQFKQARLSEALERLIRL